MKIGLKLILLSLFIACLGVSLYIITFVEINKITASIPQEIRTDALDKVVLKSRNGITRAAGISVLIACLSMGLIIISAKKSFAKLKDTTQKISQGDLSLRINIPSEDELGELAALINTIAQKAQTIQNDTEDKIEEKTKELKKRIQQLEEAQNISAERGTRIPERKAEGDTFYKRHSKKPKYALENKRKRA